mgnify:CR=1 FL=1
MINKSLRNNNWRKSGYLSSIIKNLFILLIIVFLITYVRNI